MAFIVEDGSGLANANSYQSLEAHKAYCLERGYTVPTDDKIKQDLIKATDYLTGVYRGSWIASRAIIGQRLDFPRIGTTTADYHLYALGVPEEIREATSELAIISNITPLIPSPTSRTKKRVKVGPLEVEYDGDGNTQPKFVAASLKLVPYLRGVSTIMAKLIRA